MEGKKIRIGGGFDGSNIYNIAEVNANHFCCEMKPEIPSMFKYPDHHGYWFFLKVENAYGKEVTIDITNCNWMPSHWKYYRPVLTYSDPNILNNHRWEKIDNAKQHNNTFRFTQRYMEDFAWVALRYPYTYTYHQAYMKRLMDHPLMEVKTIAKTKGGRDLDMVVITDTDVHSTKKKTVVIYAREHGVEQEGSWVSQGIIDFLLSEIPEAVALRRISIFLIVPILLPDSVWFGRCADPYTGGLISCDFAKGDIDSMSMVESKAIWGELMDMASKGNPVDICISLHSPHGWEENVWSHLHDSIKWRDGKKLNKAIFSHCNGFTKRGPEYRWGRFSLTGRCAKEFESIALLFEINQHAKRRFLFIDDLRIIGEAVCKGIHDYYFRSV